MKRTIVFTLFLFCSFIVNVSAQRPTQDSSYKKHFISSSLFMLVNLAGLEESPSFFQLNYGHRITPKDILIVEAITWKYYAPLGIPYGSQGDKSNDFPGYVRDYGIGLAYQRFIWKGLYSTVHATPFVQQYYSTEGDKIQTGFQLFTTFRLGYHFNLFKNRMFFEPSVACTYWPINTNLPDSFVQQENKWPNYFLFEPGLNIGVNF